MDNHTTKYNKNLNGYELTFANGAIAHTQYQINTNSLENSCGELELMRCKEHDSALFIKQNDKVNIFVEMNKNKGE